MISYDRLWQQMRKKGGDSVRTDSPLRHQPRPNHPLKRNESVSTHTIDMFCTILNCRVEDIMEHIQDVSLQEENEKK